MITSSATRARASNALKAAVEAHIFERRQQLDGADASLQARLEEYSARLRKACDAARPLINTAPPRSTISTQITTERDAFGGYSIGILVDVNPPREKKP